MRGNATGRYLGLDRGTSGLRAALLDEDGQLVGLWRLPSSPGEPRDEARLWWRDLITLLHRVAAQCPLDGVRALAVDGTSGTLLACDCNGEPLAPALMYDDLRASAQAGRIAMQAPADSGAHGAGSSLARLLWLLEHARLPASFFLQHQAEWLTGRLLGRYDLGDENNALKLGYDSRTARWPHWLEALSVPRPALPTIHPAGTPLGRIDLQAAKLTGLPADTLVVAGTTDSLAAFLATGAKDEGDAATTLGSTLTLKILSARPVFDPARGVYSHRLLGRWLAGGASNTGGAVLASLFDPLMLEQLSRRIDPRRRSCLDYMPLLRPGERFPVNDPTLAPRLHPRPVDDARFLHGLLDAMARIEAQGYRVLESLGAGTPRRLYTTGGGARNPAWSALRERALGCRLNTPEHDEAAVGAARLAQRGALEETP
ncbi:MAG: FGGY-family carbohydrate kinase [Halothiobacillaceae bacterium]|nr:FGGY-family carbohydrate kinase [Halothiobacillaceae bacterium]